MLRKLHRRAHPWRIFVVSVAFNFQKPFERMVRGVLDVMRAGGIAIPLPLNFVLVGVACLEWLRHFVWQRLHERLGRHERIQDQVGPSLSPRRVWSALRSPDWLARLPL